MEASGPAGVGPAMLGVGLVYSGLLFAAVGLLALVRPLRLLGLPTRRRAAAVAGLGILLFTAGALLPAPLQRAAGTATSLDEFVPVWQFSERHEIHIAAEPARVERAIREVTAREIRLFRLLTWIRNPRRSWYEEPDSLLKPPADRPILAAALESGFILLAEETGREIVIGTLLAVPEEVGSQGRIGRKRLSASLSPEGFQEIAAPGYVKAVMNFHLANAGGGRTRLATETRVFATGPGSRRSFALYWRLIYPGSALIRRMWLRAIRERAEATAQR